jgi:hypothetical protein
MTDLTPPTTSEPSSGSGGGWAPWMKLGAIALSFAVIGFVGGWIVRGEDGSVTQLEPSASEPTSTTGTTATTPAAPEEPPARSDVRLAVLNGGTVDGLAGQTADEAEALGYVNVVAENAPTQNGPTVVYFRPGNRPAAEQVATDLEFGPVRQLPASGALADAAPANRQVIVVLGTTS